MRDVINPSLLAGSFSVGGGTLEFNTVSVDTNYTGVVSGSGGLNKSGMKKLTLSGSTGNTYSGDTNIVARERGPEQDLRLRDPGKSEHLEQWNGLCSSLGDNQVAPSATVNFSGTAYGFLELLGHALTVTGLSDSTGLGVYRKLRH